MNWIDLLILAAIGLGFFSGYRRGAVMQIFSWGGFVLGLLVGATVSLAAVRAMNLAPGSRRPVALIAWFGTAFLIEAVVAVIGAKIVRRITHAGVQLADAVIGAALASMFALLAAWVVSAPARQVPDLSKAVKRSVIIRGMYAALSEPPNILTALGKVFSRTPFPDVFTSLNPTLAPGVAPAPASLRGDEEVLAAAELTYKIVGQGDRCEGIVNGSGFPARRGTVVTAAHVVAGTTETTVVRADGATFDAVVVYFDSDTDIAVLHVPSLPRQTLEVEDQQARRESTGAAIGYPGGRRRAISVARVRARTEAVGKDIYSRGEVSRDIYVLRARVVPGNSGGPFVDTEGRVRGMVFAAAQHDRDESYALTEDEIFTALRAAEGRTRPVRTGRCAIS